jgi:hypothetical protein
MGERVFNTNVYTGTDGVLTISDPEPFATDMFTAYFGEAGAVGRLTNVTVQVRTDVRAFHELGSRAPRELRAGNLHIAGTVERAFINGALLRLMLGQYGTDEETTAFAVPSFNMKLLLDNLRPEGDAGNSVLTLYGVVFDSWRVNLPEDDFVLERLSFQARRIATEDTEVPA